MKKFWCRFWSRAPAHHCIDRQRTTRALPRGLYERSRAIVILNNCQLVEDIETAAPCSRCENGHRTKALSSLSSQPVGFCLPCSVKTAGFLESQTLTKKKKNPVAQKINKNKVEKTVGSSRCKNSFPRLFLFLVFSFRQLVQSVSLILFVFACLGISSEPFDFNSTVNSSLCVLRIPKLNFLYPEDGSVACVSIYLLNYYFCAPKIRNQKKHQRRVRDGRDRGFVTRRITAVSLSLIQSAFL